ncbi:hypothetical protein FQN51_008774 [Onygenales sp. PD_10]|nr:hypothetical protein FQN51_008774 [Onygenales sp. PD_10]
MIAQKSTRLIGVVVFFAIFLLILSSTPSTSPALADVRKQAGAYAADYVHIPEFPRLPTPKLPDLPSLDSFRLSFGYPAHKPPEQKNSTSGESKWYSDWKWLNPFSSSITLDENRSVLPPLRPRPPIFTYYDSASKKEKGVSESDRQLLLTWRRAWFAKGFRPVVLGPSEAMNNPLYQSVKTQKLGAELEGEFMKWLAWGSMDVGVLADWLCFPMAEYDDPFFKYLRRETIPTHITRVENMGSALFSGKGDRINEAIKSALKRDNLKDAKTMIDVVLDEFFRAEKTSSLGYYDGPTISSRYGPVSEKLAENPAVGKKALTDLINLHLQMTFQKMFPSGVSVLRVYPETTRVLINPGDHLAALLTQCFPSMLQSSCPPNDPTCTPCTKGAGMKITQFNGYTNDSAAFTIGIVPHPYTLLSLNKGDDNVTIPYIRRETERDNWIVEMTEPILGAGRDGSSRVVPFKSIVAGDFGMSRTLWFTVETFPANPKEPALPSHTIDELDWHFGFRIPRDTVGDEKEGSEAALLKEFPQGEEEKIKKEFELIGKARAVLKSTKKEDKRIREAAEAWNLADTEVWRFVRAYRARSVVERKKWEEEEKPYAGS